jgi:outer membrane murein-binding lipoprotein Lpp
MTSATVCTTNPAHMLDDQITSEVRAINAAMAKLEARKDELIKECSARVARQYNEEF